MTQPLHKGFYIVGEGNDGTGKSTQVDMLAKYLEKEYSLQTYVMHEPAGSDISTEIRTIIKNGSLERDAITNLLLFTASRHETWYQKALPILAKGGVVLSARNYLSTEIYQGIGEGLDPGYVRQVTAAFLDQRYMNPDLTVIFSLDETTRSKRIQKRGKLENPDTFESRGKDFQDKINKGYQSIAESRGYATIDAAGSIESIQRKLRKLVIHELVQRGLSG